MKTKLNLKLLSAVIALSVPFIAEASLGKLQVQSHLNQPFAGTVTVDGSDAQTIINTPNVVSISGNQQIHASLYRRGNKVVISLSSTSIINDPVVSFSLRVGNSIRYYSAIMDPQHATQPIQAGISGSTVTPSVVVGASSRNVTIPPVSTVQQSTQQHEVQLDPVHVAEGNVVPGKVYVARPGDTIIAIARSIKPANLTLAQTMKAIIAENRNIFRGGNTNLLYVGARVRIPTYEQMTKLATGSSQLARRPVESKKAVVEPKNIPDKIIPKVKEVTPTEPVSSVVSKSVVPPVEQTGSINKHINHTQPIESVPIKPTPLEQNTRAQNPPAPVEKQPKQEHIQPAVQDQNQGGLVDEAINFVNNIWQYILGAVVALILLVLGLIFVRRKKQSSSIDDDDGIAIHSTASSRPVNSPVSEDSSSFKPISEIAPVATAATVASSMATSHTSEAKPEVQPASAVDEIPHHTDDSLDDHVVSLDIDDSHSLDELDESVFTDLGADVDSSFDQELPTHNSFEDVATFLDDTESEENQAKDIALAHKDFSLDFDEPLQEDAHKDLSMEYDDITSIPKHDLNISSDVEESIKPDTNLQVASDTHVDHSHAIDISDHDLNSAFEDVAVSRRKNSIEDQLATAQDQLDYNPSLDFSLDEPADSVVSDQLENTAKPEQKIETPSSLEWDFSPTETKTVETKEEERHEATPFVAKDIPVVNFDVQETASKSSDNEEALDFNLTTPDKPSFDVETKPVETHQDLDLALADLEDFSTQENVVHQEPEVEPAHEPTLSLQDNDDDALDFTTFEAKSDDAQSHQDEVETKKGLSLFDTDDVIQPASHQLESADPVIHHDNELNLDSLETDSDFSFSDDVSEATQDNDFPGITSESDITQEEDFSVPLYAKLELAKMYLDANDYDGAQDVLAELLEESENTNPTVYAKVQELMADLKSKE